MPVLHGFDPIIAAERASDDGQTGARARGEDERGGPRQKKAAKEPSLSAEQARRQSDVTRAAFVALGQREAITFLNGHSEDLGGRPLDVAIGSAAGFSAVEQLLQARKKPA